MVLREVLKNTPVFVNPRPWVRRRDEGASKSGETN